jgi:hypothetical protein
LRELSGRLVELTIERAKFQAQFEQLASRIGKLDVQLTSASQYEVLRMSRELALQSLKEAMMEAHALTQQYERLSPPSVSLVKAGQ